MTENEMKQHIIDNIHLLSKKDYIYFFGNPVEDIENFKKIRSLRKTLFSDFSKDELKIRANVYIKNWSWNTAEVYQFLSMEYPFV